MLEPPAPTLEESSNPRVDAPIPKRNRWQRPKCSQRPPGKDHSLGFPTVERSCDSESSASEVILFQTPIINVESQSGTIASSSSSVLPPISELRASGNSTPKGPSTPVFGSYAYEEDPWSTSEEPVPEDPRRVQSNRTAFDYGAQIWRCLREGDDPWQTD